MREYVSDMVSFYRKYWKVMVKIMAIYAAIYAAIILVVKHHQEIQYRLMQAVTWIDGKLHPAKEVETSGGLDPEDAVE